MAVAFVDESLSQSTPIRFMQQGLEKKDSVISEVEDLDLTKQDTLAEELHHLIFLSRRLGLAVCIVFAHESIFYGIIVLLVSSLFMLQLYLKNVHLWDGKVTAV